jgi:hypothetical protein
MSLAVELRAERDALRWEEDTPNSHSSILLTDPTLAGKTLISMLRGCPYGEHLQHRRTGVNQSLAPSSLAFASACCASLSLPTAE